MSIVIDLPSDIKQSLAMSWGHSESTFTQHVLQAVAVESYRQGILTRRQIGELLGLSFWETQAFLKEHKAYLPYSPKDLEDDRQSLAKVLR